jgi:hypothetical protein
MKNIDKTALRGREWRLRLIQQLESLGLKVTIEELENASLPESQAGKAREAIADRIYSYSTDEAEEYFALFYERDGLNIPNLLYQQGTRH